MTLSNFVKIILMIYLSAAQPSTEAPEPIPPTIEQQIEDKLAEREHREDKLEWFIEYKKLREQQGGYKTIFDDVPEYETDIMLKCIETETYDQDFISRCNVASVILNRAIANHTTAYEVITKPHQFAYYRDAITETTRLALEYVYEFGDTTGGCMAFRSDKRPEIWRDWTYQFTDKAGHNFYK